MLPLTRPLLLALLLAFSLPLGAEMEVHGNFRRMAHTGDSTGKIALAALKPGAGRYGVGALAGLRGEILIWDGRILVTRGHSATGATEPPQAGDAAALLVSARVSAWSEIPVPADMDAVRFERFVVDAARRHGVEADSAFAFVVRGAFPALTWHVVAGGHADKRVFKARNVEGMMLGFYSGRALEGVITHPGERLHLHYADVALRVSGHVDAYAVAAGATLLLPARAAE